MSTQKYVCHKAIEAFEVTAVDGETVRLAHHEPINLDGPRPAVGDFYVAEPGGKFIPRAEFMQHYSKAEIYF